MTMFPRIMELLDQKGADHIRIFGGVIIPAEDTEELEKLGVARIFGPGTDTRDIVRFLEEEFK
jgi:methylmalonyl-CoA mutase C-terminal domain/subunit